MLHTDAVKYLTQGEERKQHPSSTEKQKLETVKESLAGRPAIIGHVASKAAHTAI